MAATSIRRIQVAALALITFAGCSSAAQVKRAASDATDDARAGLVARDYTRALADLRLEDAYSMLLPGQRAAIDEGFYMDCLRQDDTQGNAKTSQVRTVEDNGDEVVPPGYSDPVPTRTVFVTLADGYENAPEWYGKLRVGKDAGRWYVSVAAPAFKKYGEGNCEHSMWEYPEPPAPSDTPLPTAQRAPAPPTP